MDINKKIELIINEAPKIKLSLKFTKPELPFFYDKKKFKLGQETFLNNVFGILIGYLSGLVTLFSISPILDVLRFTNESSIPCTAYQRYAKTLLHVFTWNSSCFDKILKSIEIVKKRHSDAFQKCSYNSIYNPTQLDMVLTQFAFIGYIILSDTYLGIKVNHTEKEGMIHLWHVIGNMLGIEEKYNLCTGTVEETRLICQEIFEKIYVPALQKRNKDQYFTIMNTAMLEGVWPIFFPIDSSAYTAFTLDLASYTSKTQFNHNNTMSTYSKIIYNLQHFTLKYLTNPVFIWSKFFRIILNKLLLISIYITEHFPLLAYLKFGKKYAHVNIFE